MSESEPIILFTPYFRAGSEQRQAELDECLERNIACKELAKIILLVDDKHRPPVTHPRVEIVHVDERPTYAMWVRLTRQLEPGCISILANSDIYFDVSVHKISSALADNKTFVALTRSDRFQNRHVAHPDPHWSQDVWAMRSDGETSENLSKRLELPLGVPRCDNKVAYLFSVYGWHVTNPVNFIRITHLHESGQRTYDKLKDSTVLGTVAYVHPASELGGESKLDFDVWTTGRLQPKEPAQKHILIDIDSELGTHAGSLTRPQGKDPTNEDTKLNARPESRRSLEFKDTELAFERERRFYIYQRDESFYAYDRRYPSSYTPIEGLDLDNSHAAERAKILSAFVPPVVDTTPVSIEDVPKHRWDSNFWQYPCTTEKSALTRHASMHLGTNVRTAAQEIHTYLPLPWATYIDRGSLPDEITYIKTNILGMMSLARSLDFRLRVHTVCQHINWEKLSAEFEALQLTDVHVSHCEKRHYQDADRYRFSVHSWPLIAVNVETPSRSSGLEFGKAPSQKSYFASFIGAHMLHYRSDVRLKIAKAVEADGGDDLHLELNGLWHFNQVVYDTQVENRIPNAEDMKADEQRTIEYNRVLSDSIFSLCPEGAGPNTLRVWESLAVGAIPVIIAEEWVPPSIKGHQLLEDCAIFCKYQDIDKLIPHLRSLPECELVDRQRKGMQAYSEYRNITAF